MPCANTPDTIPNPREGESALEDALAANSCETRQTGHQVWAQSNKSKRAIDCGHASQRLLLKAGQLLRAFELENERMLHLSEMRVPD